MKEKFSITIAIPVFNRLDLLKRTLASVFYQTVSPDEILIIDNHSADDTWEYLRTLKNVRLLGNRKNIGALNNINKCIREASSQFVIVLASDDIILPNAVKHWKKIISEYKDKAEVFTCAEYIIDKNDNITGLLTLSNSDKLLSPIESLRFYWNQLYFTLHVGGMTVFNKKIFEKVGYYQYIGRAEEADMTLKILKSVPVFYCSTPLFAYRIHDSSAIVKGGDDSNPKNYVDVAREAIKIYLRYEDDQQIKDAFTEKEQRARIFIRKPVIFAIVMTFYYLITFKINRAKDFFTLFILYYPKPVLSITTASLFAGWTKKLIAEKLRNLSIRKNMKNIANIS